MKVMGFILFLLSSCSGLEKSEKERVREQNAKGEYIYRMHNEHLYEQEIKPIAKQQEAYPWEGE